MNVIPFNRPCITGKEIEYLKAVLNSSKLCGNGSFTKKCQDFFEHKYKFKKCLLTTSCTDALEMAAMLLDIHEGDEVILPSYTFVSTALAFVRQGAKLVFVDSMCDHPNMNVQNIERLITDRTKVIVPVHYAGVAVDMDAIMGLAMKHNLFVVEDAAQSIDSYYKSIPLGSFGDLSCFSFHETKNITAGEGGLLVVNSDKFVRRSEILWEKGTNRSEFFRGEVNKYGWVDIGSSFLPSEFNAAVLLAQLEQMDEIQKQRIKLWDAYNKGLSVLFKKGLLFPPKIPEYATNNGHIYFVVCKDNEQRTLLMTFLKEKGIQTTFHYLSLHKSQFAIEHGIKAGILSETDRYTECLLRLPLFCSLSFDDVENIISSIYEFFKRV